MEKKINLLGIRKKVVLCRIRDMHEKIIVMMPITAEQEKELDENEALCLDEDCNNLTIDKRSTICYGEVDIDNEEDANAIKKFGLLGSGETDNIVYSNADYKTGVCTFDNVPKQFSTSDAILWYRHNACLIGNPKRVVIFKCNKSDF